MASFSKILLRTQLKLIPPNIQKKQNSHVIEMFTFRNANYAGIFVVGTVVHTNAGMIATFNVSFCPLALNFIEKDAPSSFTKSSTKWSIQSSFKA